MSARREPVGEFSTLSGEGLGEILRASRLLEPAQLDELPRLLAQFPHPQALAEEMVKRGWLTPYQVEQLFHERGQELVLGQYVLLDRLGEGGMGEVYKARHQKLGRIVALKVIRKERLSSTDAVRRFHREVQAAAQLTHPHIVLAFDADQIGSTHFLVMEYCEGIDLGRLVRQSGPLPIGQACEYIRQAALGLQHAYERGMVHRDIKPSNLLLTGGGSTVKVLDMGLARLQQPADEDSSTGPLTHEGMVMGTLDYIAPEQALESHTVDIRADLYSLGCTFYYLLTGKVPFPGGTFLQKINKHQFEEPQAVEQLRLEVPPALAAVVRKLMAKRPADRYQTPAEVATALASWSRADVMAGSREQTVAFDLQVPSSATVEERPAPSPAPERLSREEIGAGTEARSDSGLGWSSIVTPPTEDEATRWLRLRKEAEKRRMLLLSVTSAGLLLGTVVLFVALLVRSSQQQGGAEPAPQPATKDKGKIADAEAQVFEQWLKSVAALPAEKQVAEVVKKLKDLNPGFDGNVPLNTIDGGAVTELGFVTDAVTDISPLRALAGLKSLSCGGSAPGKGRLFKLTPLKDMKLTALDCGGTQVLDLSPLKDMKLTKLLCAETKVSDLSPLKGMPLTNLQCNSTQVSDLSPLKGMPLTFLNFAGTQVSDLSPLKGMPLTYLYCGGTPVSDLTPLKGMPLTTLHCGGTQVSDLSPLKGMPLTELGCWNTNVSDLSPLKDMKLTSLESYTTGVSDLSPLKDMKLTLLSCGGTRVSDLAPLKGMPLKFLSCNYTLVFDLSPLKGMPLTDLDFDVTKVSDLTPLKGMQLKTLKCGNTKVADLSPLKEMPLTGLWCFQTKVSDLSPLKGMPLTALHFSVTKVSDLSPLKGMPLTSLNCYNTPVADLSPLKGMPLTSLNCSGTPVSDLSPLKGMSLKELWCDFKPERDAEILRSIKTLEKINGKPARELWKEVDEQVPKKP